MEEALLLQGEGCPTMSKDSRCCGEIPSAMCGAPVCQGPWLVSMQYSSNIHTTLVFIGLPNWQGIDLSIY